MFKKIKLISEKVLLVLFLLTYLVYSILNIGISRLSDKFEDIFPLLIISFAGLYAILAPLKKLSNVVLFLLSASILGILNGLLTPYVFYNFTTMNVASITIIFLVVAVKSFFVIKNNIFFKWLLFITSMIILLYFLFLASYITSSIPKSAYNFIYILFCIVTLAMIFGFPNSNYADWVKEHRQIFVRMILSIWLFIFVISTLQLFIPFDKYQAIIFPESIERWGMKNYLIDPKPGLRE